MYRILHLVSFEELSELVVRAYQILAHPLDFHIDQDIMLQLTLLVAQ